MDESLTFPVIAVPYSLPTTENNRFSYAFKLLPIFCYDLFSNSRELLMNPVFHKTLSVFYCLEVVLTCWATACARKVVTTLIACLFEVGESAGDQGAVQTMHGVWIQNTELTVSSVFSLRVHQTALASYAGSSSSASQTELMESGKMQEGQSVLSKRGPFHA